MRTAGDTDEGGVRRRKKAVAPAETRGRMKRLTLERLTRYYICLCDNSSRSQSDVVSSARIAECVGVDDTQVRKDLALIGVRGRPRVGFKRGEVIAAIRGVLGFEKQCKAVIVGAGRLGGAIAEYPGFADFGLSIVAFFDNDPEKFDAVIGGCKVYSTGEMKQVIRELGARLAILTCPADSAQVLADELVDAGIRAIWNFAPTTIVTPEDVIVGNEHVSVGLVALTYYLRCSE